MTCRNTSLVEVGQDAAIYVGEDDVDEMVDIMLAFERSTFDVESFAVRVRDILSQFTWEKCSYDYIDFYNRSL